LYVSSPPVSYYSSANPNVYIADAKGKSFIRTEFERNALSRVHKQGGAGEIMSLKSDDVSGHNITGHYGAVSQVELDRVFGNEAPSAPSVVKVITEDANGIRSLSYTSKAGQTLATALDGASQADESVSLLPVGDEAGGGFAASYSLVEGTKSADGHSRTQSMNVILAPNLGNPTALQPIFFTYEILQKTFGIACEDICRTCDYSIKIAVNCPQDMTSGNKMGIWSFIYQVGIYIIIRAAIMEIVVGYFPMMPFY